MALQNPNVILVHDALKEARDKVVDCDWFGDWKGAARWRQEVKLLQRAADEGVEFYPLF